MTMDPLLREVERWHTRVLRAYNRLLLGTLALLCVSLSTVPVVVMVTGGNPWYLLLLVPAVAIPMGAQTLGFHFIDRKYGAR